MRLRESFGALGDRRFAWYFAARTISIAGSSMAPVALTFAVLELTGSAGALAQVLAARTATMVVFLLVGGVVSDRMSRTSVMQMSHALTFLTQGLAAALFITGRAELGVIIAIEAVNGAVSAFTVPAMMGVVPLVVDRSRLQQANALLSFSRSGLTIIGPSVAGVLVVTVGAGWALAADSVAYVLAILCLLRVRLPGRVRDARTGAPSMVAELREGWGEFTSRTWLWLVVVVFGVLNAIQVGSLSVVGPLIATRVPALGVSGWALALSARAVGTVVMTLFMLRLSFRFPLRAGMIGVAAMAVPIGLLGVAPTTWPLVMAMVAGGAGIEVFGRGMEHHIARTHPGGGALPGLQLRHAGIRRGHPRRYPRLRRARCSRRRPDSPHGQRRHVCRARPRRDPLPVGPHPRADGRSARGLTRPGLGIARRAGAERATSGRAHRRGERRVDRTAYPRGLDWALRCAAPARAATPRHLTTTTIRRSSPPVSITDIRLFGDPILRTPALDVVDFDKELQRLVADLTDTMLAAPGRGLAAPQLGVGLRVFTYAVDDVVGHLVNPRLELSSELQLGPEGCLSFPGMTFDTSRALRVVASGFNMNGEPVRLEGSDLLARCVQHETDHLDGILFIDRLDPEQRRLAMRAIRESDWGGPTPLVKVSPHGSFGRGL